MTTLFISDLHLSDNSPTLSAKFQQFMQDVAPGCEALYILGDLFEVFIGEDDDSPCQQMVFRALKALSEQGSQIYLMPGNRDFLYSKKGLARFGITLLKDPYLLKTPQAWLLTHGDQLNLDDKAYLRYRKIAQHPITKSLFLKLPLRFRRKIADKLRKKSVKVVTQYQDAQLAEIDRWRKRHACPRILHGHTHIPLLQLTDFTHESPAQRLVLSDWGPNGHYCVMTADQAPQIKQLDD